MLRSLLPIVILAAACTPSLASEPRAEPQPFERDEAPPPTEQQARPEPAAPPVKLADAPTVDLYANQHRWHMYREGLVVPFASEGIRKYSHEYRAPLGEVVQHAGHPGRVLARSKVRLRFPWTGEERAVLRVHAHGLAAKQRFRFSVNGTRLGGVAEHSDRWGQSLVQIPAKLLTDGENEIVLEASTSAKVGGTRSYGLLHSVEIVPQRAAEMSMPALTPAIPDRRALGGVPKLRLYQEIPRNAWLSFEPSGAAGTAFRISAHPHGKDPLVLLETKATDRARTEYVDLAPIAGQLVVLELESDGEWGAPKIALKAQKPAAAKTFDNAILLVVDALRSDRLALYGPTRVQTPRFTGSGSHAAVFLHNQAASPSSPPSHASIQTGMIPRVHGVTGDRGQIKAKTPMISSQLAAAGVVTAYVGNNSFGMSRLRKAGNWNVFRSPISEGKGADCTALVDELLKFVADQKKAGKRFFVSALPFEPHTPYRYHDGITDKYHPGPWEKPVGKYVDGYLLNDVVSGKKKLDDGQWAQLKALYDGEVEHMDRCFGQLEDGLAELGLRDDTAIVLTSDHGEGMFEHERLGHAYGHFAELSNVPLVVYAPGLVAEGPLEVPVVSGHLDVAPTVLALMGVEPAPQIQGDDLIPLIRAGGEWTPRVASLEYGRSYALRSAGWKLIVDYSERERLFDQVADPLEQTDLSDSDFMALRYLRDVSGFFLAHRADWRNSEWGNWVNHSDRFVKSR